MAVQDMWHTEVYILSKVRLKNSINNKDLGQLLMSYMICCNIVVRIEKLIAGIRLACLCIICISHRGRRLIAMLGNGLVSKRSVSILISTFAAGPNRP